MGKGVLLSLAIIAIGLAWLLNTLHVIGGVDWIWTIALAGTGVDEMPAEQPGDRRHGNAVECGCDHGNLHIAP